MKVFVRLLEEQAERCIELAHQCHTQKAERVLRLLAVDLMLAAEGHRTRRAWQAGSAGGSETGDKFSELEQVMRSVTFMTPRNGSEKPKVSVA